MGEGKHLATATAGGKRWWLILGGAAGAVIVGVTLMQSWRAQPGQAATEPAGQKAPVKALARVGKDTIPYDLSAVETTGLLMALDDSDTALAIGKTLIERADKVDIVKRAINTRRIQGVPEWGSVACRVSGGCRGMQVPGEHAGRRDTESSLSKSNTH